MHPDIFQFLNQKRIVFLSVNVSCKFQFANIMKYSCNGKLITELLILPQLLRYRIRKITDRNSVIQFGRQIKATVLETLKRLEVTDAKVTVVDKGALDCTLKARVECAVYRSNDVTENLPWGGVIK